MIEIANALRDANVRPRRSLVFLAVGAEERGMLGSLYWTRHPTWLLDRVVANLNMDGGDAEAWGPLHGIIDLTRQATLVDPTAEIGAATGVPVLPDNTSGGWSGSSDFYDFLRAGIPAIQLMGIGGDPALSRERLQRFGSRRVHRPGDVIDEGWDWAGPREMAEVYLLLGLRVANADGRPRFREGSPFRSAASPDDAGRIEVVPDARNAAPPDTSEVLELNREILRRMIEEQDPGRLQQAALDDYVVVAPGGRVETLDQAVAGAGSFSADATIHVTDEQFVRHGETAVVVGKLVIDGEMQPVGTLPPMKFMAVFVRSEGRWRLLSRALTPCFEIAIERGVC